MFRVLFSSGIITAAFIIYVSSLSSQSSMRVQSDRLRIATVAQGTFQSSIPLTASIVPSRTVYLDAVEGGQVQSVLVESGRRVQLGDTILILSNTSLLLDIMNREAQLFEQRNNLRNSYLALQQNALSLEGQLLDLDHQRVEAKRVFDQHHELMFKKLISENEYLAVKENYEYLIRRQEITKETISKDSVFRGLQIEMLEMSVKRIEHNLAFVKNNLENLTILAPGSGLLTGMRVHTGESISLGQRLGQIDISDEFKITASVDEYYISDIHLDLHAQMELANNRYDLKISKIFPEVNNGIFEIELQFTESKPSDIARGQTVHLRLLMGQQSEAILLKRGPFQEQTGGQWAFVISDDGQHAIKREIRLGRQNPDEFEVLHGLKAGERVIISSYDSFGDAGSLEIINN